MLLKKYTPFIFLCTVLIGQFGCTKHAQGISGPAGPAGPAGANGVIKASAITGFIALYDQYGIQEPSNTGVSVSTLNGDTLVTATTDSLGKFSLPPLPPGNYALHVKKNRFDSLKVFVQHSGGDEAKFIGNVRLAEHVTAKIISEALSVELFDLSSYHMLMVNLSFDGPPSSGQKLRHFTFYFSKLKTVSSMNYDAMAPSNNVATANAYHFQYIIENLKEGGRVYAPGDTVYVKTCVSPVSKSASTWFDYATNRTIDYPYLGDSVVNYFVWPN